MDYITTKQNSTYNKKTKNDLGNYFFVDWDTT